MESKENNSPLGDCFGLSLTSISDPSSGSIEATGDPFIDKPKNCARYAFQNVNSIGIREGLDFMPETVTIGAFQIDVEGLPETNVPWSKANKGKDTVSNYTTPRRIQGSLRLQYCLTG